MRAFLHDLFHWHKWKSIGQVDGHIPLTYVHDARVCVLCNTHEVGMLHWGHRGWFEGDYEHIDESELDQWISDKRESEEKRKREMHEHEKSSITHALNVLRKYSD